MPALNQNINKTSVHSPYVRQALSLLSLAWITPWNGWEVFNLTWKERNVNIKLNTCFSSHSPSWSPGCRWLSRWVRDPSLGPGSGSVQPPNINLCSECVDDTGRPRLYLATIQQSGLFLWVRVQSDCHNGFYLGDNAGSQFQVGYNHAKEVIWNADKNENIG